jgi:hypothetical protein
VSERVERMTGGTAAITGNRDTTTVFVPATRRATVSAAGGVFVGAVAFAVGLTGDHPGRFAGRYGFALAIWVLGMGGFGLWATGGD